MARIPLNLPPGVWRNGTQYESKGRYYNANLVRWFSGQLRPWGGWSLFSTTAIVAPPVRGMINWIDNSGLYWLMLGALNKVYVSDFAGEISDITPLRKTSAGLTNPFSTTNTQTTAKVTDTAHGAAVGDSVTFSGATGFAGITAGQLNQKFTITTIVDANNYDITLPVVATATTTGGGTVSAAYDISGGRADATNAAGYGAGAYGQGNYGVSSGSSAVTQPATVWTMDTLEQTPVACNADVGLIFSWDLNTAHLMTQCSGSPSNNRACFVTPEGFLVAVGAGGDPRALQWADQDSLTAWTPTANNQARSYELMSSGQAMCGVATRGGSLIFTTTDVHLMTYLGLPFVYSVVPVGTQCGIISQAAYADAEDFVAWMGVNAFWRYDGAVEAVPSDVSDFVFGNINQAQRSKVWAEHNAAFGEVKWFYPSAASTEIDSYVCWNYREGHWAIGSLIRTSGVQPGVLTNPVMVDASGNIWNHETGFSYTGGSAPFAETGPIEWDTGALGESLQGAHPGTYNFDIVEMLPDALTLGDFTVTFFSRFYPLGPETTYGPFNQGDPTTFRIPGREVRLRYTGTGSSDFRVGNPRLDFRPAGSR